MSHIVPPDPAAPSTTPGAPSVAAIFLLFLRIGLLSFGGGLTGWVYRDVVVLQRWMSEDEFMSGVALGQILPGANITNLAFFVGDRLRGPPGAVAAFIGLLIGPFFVLIALVSVYDQLKALPHAEAAMQGIAAAAIGMLLMVVVRGAKRAARSSAALIAFAATFVAVAVMQWPFLIVVAIVGPLSVIAAWRSAGDA